MNADLVKASVSNASAPVKPSAPSTVVNVVDGAKPASGNEVSEVVKQPAVTSKEVSSAVEDISKHIQNIQRNLSFTIDEDSGSTVVKVIDTESEEVIRQYPTEEILEIRRHLSEMTSDELTGILVKTEA